MGDVLKKYRVMLLVVIVAGLSMFAVSCGSDPTSDFIDDCVTNNTAAVKFKNMSDSRYFDAWLDGTIILSNLAPGTTSSTYTTSVGTHTVQFYDAGTQNPASGEGSYSLTQCSTSTFESPV